MANAAAVLVSLFSATAQPTDWTAVVAQAHPAVVRVLAETDRWTTCGSGVVISSEGYILTAGHLLGGAHRIIVMVQGLCEYEASVVEVHPYTDVVLLKIGGTGLSVLPLGFASALRDGEEVCVLGYTACGPTLVVTFGRVRDMGDGFSAGTIWYGAPVQRGHSGGPVINARGELVGVHFEQPVAEGGGRAVTVEVARSIVPYGVSLTFAYPRELARRGVPVYCVALSPSGLLAAGTDDGAAVVWDVATGRQVHLLLGHGGPVWSVAFGPSGTLLATGSGDGMVRTWDVATGELVRAMAQAGGPVYTVTFGPAGGNLASGAWGARWCCGTSALARCSAGLRATQALSTTWRSARAEHLWPQQVGTG